MMDGEAMIRNLAARLELIEAKFDHPALAEILRPKLPKEPEGVTNRERWLTSEVERLTAVAEMRRDEADRERLERRDCERWLRSIKETLRPWWSDYGSNWDGSLCGLPIVVESVARKFAERDRLWGLCVNFVEEQAITCPEAILQRDAVMEAAPGFIEGVCEIVDYAEPDDEGPTS